MNPQARETLLPHELLIRPWQYLATDLLHFNSVGYLIVRKMSAQVTMRIVFSENGIPERVICNNDRQYSAEGFKDFAET